VAKQRHRTDWQLDLKPVALTKPATTPRKASPKDNGAHPSDPGATSTDPAVIKALTELRANQDAILESLAGIRTTLVELRSGFEELGARVGLVESQFQQTAEPERRPKRAVSDTARSLRASSSGTFDRAPARRRLRVADEDSPQ